MPCRFEDHPTVPVTSVHSLVAIARNGWSRSIGTPGRYQLEQVVAITRYAQQGNREYRITATGLKHPQRRHSGRQAQAPRLPVESDRVRNVLSAILDAVALRIRDVTDVLKILRETTNALMQYLKRKTLVQKSVTISMHHTA